MYINQIFELSMTLDNKRFQKIFKRKHKKSIYAKMDEEEYIDESMTSKGITVIYRDSQYKKKIKLIIDPGLVSESRSSDKLIRKLAILPLFVNSP